MQATDVDVLVALNAIIQTLVQGLALLWSGEDGGHSRWDGRILLHKHAQLSLGNSLSLGTDRTESSRHGKLLRGGSGVAGAVCRDDPGSRVSVSHASKERSARSGLGRSGRVRSAAVVEARQVSKSTLHSVAIRGCSTRGVRDHVGAIAARDAALMHVMASRDARAIDRVHGVRSLDVASIARVDN